MNKLTLGAALILAGLSVSAMAEVTGQQQRREPPPQAFEICKGKSAGDTVQITTPQGQQLSATCTESPKGLFARPPHPPGQQGK